MKQFIVGVFLCVAFPALVNAAEQKIAYTRGKKIFVANADGTHSKKIADGAWPEISPDGTRAADGCRLRLGARAQELGMVRNQRLKSSISALTRPFASRARMILFGNRFG
jgi:hypothetical protein